MPALKLFLIFSFIFVQAYAQDMSHLEDPFDSYDEEGNYQGKCLTHEDYLDRHFSRREVLIKYTERPDLTGVPLPVLKLLEKHTELTRAEMELGEGIDDFELDVVQFKSQLFFRFNIGVGGGNGFYFIVRPGPQPKLISHTFDRDLLYCDLEVWQQ
jgi:hypothetical protein